MCGRFASYRDAEDLADEFAVQEIADGARSLPPNWNVAPTDPVRIVVERERAGRSQLTRSLQVARWGLVPPWAKDPRSGARMINARVETLLTRRAFAVPLAKRRCLVPAEGYYEWQRNPAGAKQPFYIRPSSGTLAFAGLFDFWRDPARDSTDAARWLVTVSIVTTAASADLAPIHDRMPICVPSPAWDRWLDPSASAEESAALLTNGLGETQMALTCVSDAVNSVRNNGPELIEPSTTQACAPQSR